MRISRSFILIFSALLLSAPTFTTAAELKAYHVGAFWPMTGLQAYYGRLMRQGTITAIDEINASGGIQGFKLNLIVTDFRDISVELAVSGVRKMISIDKTPFLLGSFSGCLLGAQPIAAENRVLIFNGGGASPALANRPYLHNVRMHLGLIYPSALEYFWQKGYRKLAVLSYHDPSGTVTRDEVVIPLWTKWGGKVVANEMNEVTAVDFSAQAARIKAGSPEIIVNLQAGELSGYAVKGLREMGLTCPIVNSEWNPASQKIAGLEFSKNVFTCLEFFDRTDNHPLTQKFVKVYEKRWKEEADFFAANYYDSINILAELIKRVKSKGGDPLQGSQLEAAIWDNQVFDSVYGGKLQLIKDGTVRKESVLFEMVGGKLTVIKRYKVE